jgi:hypothetical protein
MNRAGKSEWRDVLIGVAVIIIAALIIGGGSISGVLSYPKPIKIIQSEGEVCPTRIWFSSGEGSFKFELRNTGREGSLFVNISSTTLLVREKERSNFENSSIRWLVVPSGEYSNFEFDTLRNDESEQNISIRTEYGCKGIFCKNYYCYCRYQRQEGSTSNYDLTGGKDSC